MGSSIGSTGLTMFATLMIAVAAILIILADSKVRELPGYPTVDNINLAHTDLVYSQIFAWIATALALILAIGYGLSIKFLLTQWPHLILYLLVIACLIVSIIYLAMALNRINNLSDDKGASGYIYGAIILLGLSLLILTVSLILGWSHTSTDPNAKRDVDKAQRYDDSGYGYSYQAPPDYRRSESQKNRYNRGVYQPVPITKTTTSEYYGGGPPEIPAAEMPPR